MPDGADPALVDELPGQRQGRCSAVGEAAHRVDAPAGRLAGGGRHLLGLRRRCWPAASRTARACRPAGRRSAISGCMSPGVQMSTRSMSSRSMTRASRSRSTAKPSCSAAARTASGVPAGDRGELGGHRQVEEPVGVPPRLGVHGAHERVPDHADPQRLRLIAPRPVRSAQASGSLGPRCRPTTSCTDVQDPDRRGSAGPARSDRLARRRRRARRRWDPRPCLGRADRRLDHREAEHVAVHLARTACAPVPERGDELGQRTGDLLRLVPTAGGDRPAVGGLRRRARGHRPRCARAAAPLTRQAPFQEVSSPGLHQLPLKVKRPAGELEGHLRRPRRPRTSSSWGCRTGRTPRPARRRSAPEPGRTGGWPCRPAAGTAISSRKPPKCGALKNGSRRRRPARARRSAAGSRQVRQ